MSEYKAKHLVLVRHGESEGDVRRAMTNQPRSDSLKKHPKDEEQTPKGHKECQLAGQWITRHILQEYGLGRFDLLKVSPLIRTVQSAESLGLNGVWGQDVRLAERDRGMIQGMTKNQHEQEYPDSYNNMKQHPFHWTPPGGESLLRVSMRFGELAKDFIEGPAQSAVLMTHRDVLWSAHIPLDNVSLGEIEKINTDLIYNGYLAHYTNINPDSGLPETTDLLWKRTCTPWQEGLNAPAPSWENISAS